MPFSREPDSSEGAKEIVLHSFDGGADGASPYCGLVCANDVGVFYGTTAYGGRYNEGTVFKLTTAGAENVLYTFAGGTGVDETISEIRGQGPLRCDVYAGRHTLRGGSAPAEARLRYAGAS